MQRPEFFDGQLSNAVDLNRIETDLIANIKNASVGAAASHGILSGLTCSVVAPFTLRIFSGVAYDSAGERIVLSANLDVSFAAQPSGTYVYLNLSEASSGAATLPLTGVSVNTRMAQTTPTTLLSTTLFPTAVAIVRLDAITGGGGATLNFDNTSYWSARIAPASIADDRFDPAYVDSRYPLLPFVSHFTAVGTGVVTNTNPHGNVPADLGFTTAKDPEPHQRLDHRSGVEPAGLVAVLGFRSATDPNSDLFYAVKDAGAQGDTFRLAHVLSGPNVTLDVTISSQNITVHLATDGVGASISTAQEVVDAVNADVDVNQLIVAAILGDGTGVVQATDFRDFTGGQDYTAIQDFSLVTVVPGTPDSLSIAQAGFGFDKSVLVDGTRLSALVTSSVAFTDGSVQQGLYEVALQKDGLITKSLRAYYLVPSKVAGVTIADIDHDHPEGEFNLAFIVGDNVSLRWAGGVEQTLDIPADTFDGNQLYELLSGTSPQRSIRVWVNFGQLSGSPQQDVISVSASQVKDRLLQLASVPWSGNQTGKLGYGPPGSPARVYDRREIGNTQYGNLLSEIKTRIGRLHADMHRPGWYRGGSLKLQGGFTVSVEPGVAWVEGRRVEIGSTILTMPASATSWVYVDEEAVAKVSTVDPGSAYNSFRSAKVARVQTDDHRVLTVWDERIVLPETDDLVRLGTFSLTTNKDQQIPRLAIPQGGSGADTDKHRGRTLAYEADATDGFCKIRMYFTHYNQTGPTARRVGVEWVMNARWNPVNTTGADNRWIPDNLQMDAALYGFDNFGAYFKVKRRREYGYIDPVWNDTATTDSPAGDGVGWDNTVLDYQPIASNIMYFHTTPLTDASGTKYGLENPPPTEPLTNCLTPKSLLKMFAQLDINGPAVTARVIDGFNVSPAAVVVSDARVTFAMTTGLSTFLESESSTSSIRAVRIGASASYLVTVTGANDIFSLKIDGGSVQNITIAHAAYTLAQLVTFLNAYPITGASADSNGGQLAISSNTSGLGSSVETVASSALATLGFTAGTTTGSGSATLAVKVDGTVVATDFHGLVVDVRLRDDAGTTKIDIDFDANVSTYTNTDEVVNVWVYGSQVG